MKKIMMALALTFGLGSVAVAQDAPKGDKAKTEKCSADKGCCKADKKSDKKGCCKADKKADKKGCCKADKKADKKAPAKDAMK